MQSTRFALILREMSERRQIVEEEKSTLDDKQKDLLNIELAKWDRAVNA